MKHVLFATLLAVGATRVMAADVGISINVNEPGFYGQIDLGSVPQPPPLIYAQPVVIAQDPRYIDRPIYLHVPPGHERHWDRHCAEYNACGRPVYFVRDDWYRREYAPRHGHHSDGRDDNRGHHHDHDEGYGRGGDHEHGHDHEHDTEHDYGHND